MNEGDQLERNMARRDRFYLRKGLNWITKAWQISSPRRNKMNIIIEVENSCEPCEVVSRQNLSLAAQS